MDQVKGHQTRTVTQNKKKRADRAEMASEKIGTMNVINKTSTRDKTHGKKKTTGVCEKAGLVEMDLS